MNLTHHLLLDDRGISRPIEELWIPALDPDLVWWIADDDIPPDAIGESLPAVVLSPTQWAAAAAERPDPAIHRILVVFTSLEQLTLAARFGVQPQPVTVVHRRCGDDCPRIASQVYLEPAELLRARTLADQGFEFHIQAIPRVTSRRLPLHPPLPGTAGWPGPG
jgi:mannose/fructose/N-acetylgalactosamine-specific phosphotransferase system component IIB